MADKEMTPQERTARIAALLGQMLDVLPATSALLVLTPEQIRQREEEALRIGDEINRLARHG